MRAVVGGRMGALGMPERMSKPRLQFKPLGDVVCKRCVFVPLSAERLGQVPGLKTKI